MHPPVPARALLAAACLAALPSLARAQAEARRLDAIDVVGRAEEGLDRAATSGSRLDISLRELPAAVTVVDRAALDARGVRTTQEALFAVPGLSVASPPGNGNAVTYRGFSGSQIAQLFNGISVQYDSIAARPVDGWMYERVEAIGGPSTFLYGAGAVGGAINYVTRLADPAHDRIQALASVGSFDSRTFALGVNQRLGTPAQALRLDLSRSATDGWIDRARRDAWTAAGSWRSEMGPTLTHTLAVEHQQEDAHSPYWGTPVVRPSTGRLRLLPGTERANYNVGDGYYGQDVLWARSLTEWTPRAGTALRNTVYHYDALRDYRNVETYRATSDNGAVERSGALLQRHDQAVYGNRLEWRQDTQLAGLPSQWSAGLDVSFNRQTRFPRSISGTIDVVPIDAVAPGGFFDIPGMAPGFEPDRTNRLHTQALFVENLTRLHERWSLLTGVRHDRIDLDVVNHRTPSASNPARFDRQYRPTTGRVGLTFAATPGTSVYAQFATSADPPAGILSTASFANLRDFDLSRGRQGELGTKFDVLDGTGWATLAAYRIVRTNLAIADPQNPGQTLPVGRQSSRGVEAAFGLQATDALRIDGNLAWVDARLDVFVQQVGTDAVSFAGNRPTNTPARVGNVWLSYALSPQWSLGADGRAVSRRHADAANAMEVGGYAVWGAFLRWQPQPGTTVTLRGRNLGDRSYASFVTGTPMLYLGEPRGVELALRADF